MPANIYALLVGIDRYLPPVPPLNGCVNDMLSLAEYLQSRVDGQSFRLHLQTLKDQEATRERIIKGFREHLKRAGKEDFVFFFYAGHGSQEPAPPEFWHIEPDRLDETLVCWDSRQPGSWDLADKELSKLIAEVAAAGAQVTVMLDCCHSGSGTRAARLQATAVRRAPIDQRQRPLDTFIFTPAELDAMQPSTRAATKKPAAEKQSRIDLPEGRHLLFAACRDTQEAKEYYAEGRNRGAFSYFLLRALQTSSSHLTARDLMKWTSALVRANVIDQMPQLEASSPEDLDRPFLGGAIRPQPAYFTVTHDEDHGWTMDGGAVHGIKEPAGDETTRLALFAADAAPETLDDLSAAVGRAEVTETLADRSRLKLEGIENPDETMAFKAVVTGLPVPAMGVLLEGDKAGVELARTAISTSRMGEPSVYVREVKRGAQFRLVAEEGEYTIARPSDGRPLVARIKGYTEEQAAVAVRRLEHIARWKNISELDNPNSRIPADAVRMVIYENDREVTEPELRLRYAKKGGKWTRPGFKLKLYNSGKERFYCALLALSERYAVQPGLFRAGGVWLKPGQEAWALEGKVIQTDVPNALFEQGITQVTDVLKLLVCTAEFDPRLLRQDALDMPQTRQMRPETKGLRQNTLNRLMNRVQTRDILGASDEEEDEYRDDWRASTASIITVRPREAATVPSRGLSAALDAGVELEPHPTLKAEARLSTVSQVGHDLGRMALPRVLLEEPTATPPLQFTENRGSSPGLSVLELLAVEHHESVTPAQPLVLNLPLTLAGHEHVLPVAFDGEFFLPLGYAERESGRTRIRLVRLPPPVKGTEADSENSIRILFRKVFSAANNAEPKETPAATTEDASKQSSPDESKQSSLLASAEVEREGGVRFETSAEKIRERVKSAERILLCLPGLFSGARPLAARLASRAPQTLVLALADESFEMPVPEAARRLKESLQALGVDATGGKRLSIIAQDGGGLVARWLVEREGEAALTSDLKMLGAPDLDDAQLSLDAQATARLSLALNHLTPTLAPPEALGSLMAAIERPGLTFEQLSGGADLRRELEESDDPQLPYTLVSARTPLVADALKKEDDGTSLVTRLLARLSLSSTVDADALAGLLFEAAGEEASAREASTRLKSFGAAERQPPLRVVAVECDELSFFNCEEALELLVAEAPREGGEG